MDSTWIPSSMFVAIFLGVATVLATLADGVAWLVRQIRRAWRRRCARAEADRYWERRAVARRWDRW